MCGIVGLFLKDQALQPKLGAMLADMLAKLGDRGPDSAGLAIYSGADDGVGKLTAQSAEPAEDFSDLAAKLGKAIGVKVEILRKVDDEYFPTIPNLSVFAEAMFGGAVDTIAHEEFPIHREILQAVPEPPDLPPPCPAGEAEVPDMVGESQTMGIARDVWVAAGFVEANFDPPLGVVSTGPPPGRNVNKITTDQSLLKNECAVQATAIVDMDFAP